MVRARILSLTALLGFLTLAGCQANHYEIDLTPKNGSIERKITTWRTGGDEKAEAGEFPEDELKEIASAYNSPVPKKRDVKHRFAGVFAGEMPGDVGGAGRYLHWETSLGSTSGYIERFRGDDDLLSNVEGRFQAADRLVDLAIGWLETEVKEEAGFQELRKFLDNQFRRDLKNLSLYAWSNWIVTGYEGEKALADFLIRSGQYLAEHSYLSWDELPQMARAMDEADAGNPNRLLEMAQRILAAKMGVSKDQPLPPSLKLLADHKRLTKSTNAYLRETDEFKALMKTWQENRNQNPDASPKPADPPKPADVIGDLAGRAFAVPLGPSDQLSVKLAVPTAPIETNGEWDEDAKQIRWTKSILAKNSKGDQYPALLYANWSEPNALAQTRRFGKVLLKGEELYGYCLWFHGLSESEAKEWEDFLTSLKPDQDLETRLGSFRFKQAENAELAKTPRKLIQSALKNENE